MEEILEKMQRYKVFSKIHLKDGYYQKKLHHRDTEKTDFQLKLSRYEMCGCSKKRSINVPKIMDEFSVGIGESVQTYIDDIIVFRFYNRD